MSSRFHFLAQTKERFGFLLSHGFRIESEREGTYASFKDGFEVSYTSKEVAIRVAYYDMELDVVFGKGKVRAHYLFLDHNLHSNASGYAGCMFPIEKLGPVIDGIAKDIELNYEAVLDGDDALWRKIEKLVSAPMRKKPYLP